jgi:hypothetical protein
MDTRESGNLEGKRLQCYSPHFTSNQLVSGIVFVWAKLRATISISICCIIVQQVLNFRTIPSELELV